MSRTGFLPALLALTLTLCFASSADARKWRSRHHHVHDYPAVFRDEIRRPPRVDRRTRSEGGSIRAAQPAERANAAVVGGPFTTAIDSLIRACLQQAEQFQSWPFDDIVHIAAPDDRQRAALDELRAAASAAAKKLAAECPKEVTAPAWARIDAVDHSLAAAGSAFAAVEPTLQTFYAGLDDEQKARLLRDLMPPKAQGRPDARTAEPRPLQHANEERAAGNHWAGICERLTTALRDWPTSEIERSVRFSDSQRVAFYELVTSSLKAAEALARSCPAETALTPVGRMATLRVRLAAVVEAAAAIRPALRRFYEALDQEQRVRFAMIR
jgi:LTXXQ motif family protein